MTTRKGQRTTTQKGLGWEHQEQRRKLLRAHVDGTPCGHCGQPMFKWQALDADHELARAHGGRKANRLLHASCNRSRKDGTRDNPALKSARDDRAKWCLLPWV